MLKTLMAATVAVGALAASVTAAQAETVKVLVMQHDSDRGSLGRDNRIQDAVLISFNNALSAPNAADIYRKYGIDGLDVYSEKSLTSAFDEQDRTRRKEQEILEVVSNIRNPRIDIIVLYTLYARAVKGRHSSGDNLHMSLSYRALDARSGRFLGGDNLDIDTRGMPFVGCASGPGADELCVTRFVARNASRLVSDASVVLATQVASMVAGGVRRSDGPIEREDRRADSGSGSAPIAGSSDGFGTTDDDFRARAEQVCRELPRQYTVTFQGISNRDMHYLTRRMHEWPCRIDIGLDDSSRSQASYSYKVRANEATLKRTLELTLEFMGIDGTVNTNGTNELVVNGYPLRRN